MTVRFTVVLQHCAGGRCSSQQFVDLLVRSQRFAVIAEGLNLLADGRVERLDDQASDALFASRLRAAGAAATASVQSRPLNGEAALRARFDAAGWGSERLQP